MKKCFYFEKIVRDGLIERLRRVGGTGCVRELSHDETIRELKKKVLEEAQEVAGTSSMEELVGEVADLQEGLEALMKHMEVKQSDIDKCKAKKFAERGCFGTVVYFNSVTVPVGSSIDGFSVDGYLSGQPDVYPEITEELLGGIGKCDTPAEKVFEWHIARLCGGCSPVARFIEEVKIAPPSLVHNSSVTQLKVVVNDLILFDRALPDMIKMGYRPIGENGVPNRRLFCFVDDEFSADIHCFVE
ncbi:hypothetical protein HOD08_00245 [bacterium]|jgi:predicted house-cleaning noncanonical NTP pyrophosphatase (MazG superfamily)|nr:hypothetical protein [bacterium]